MKGLDEEVGGLLVVGVVVTPDCSADLSPISVSLSLISLDLSLSLISDNSGSEPDV